MLDLKLLRSGGPIVAAGVALALAVHLGQAWAEGQEATQEGGQVVQEGLLELPHDDGREDRDAIRDAMIRAATHDLPPGSPGTLHGVVIEDGLRVKARGRRLAPRRTSGLTAVSPTRAPSTIPAVVSPKPVSTSGSCAASAMPGWSRSFRAPMAAALTTSRSRG